MLLGMLGIVWNCLELSRIRIELFNIEIYRNLSTAWYGAPFTTGLTWPSGWESPNFLIIYPGYPLDIRDICSSGSICSPTAQRWGKLPWAAATASPCRSSFPPERGWKNPARRGWNLGCRTARRGPNGWTKSQAIHGYPWYVGGKYMAIPYMDDFGMPNEIHEGVLLMTM